MQVAGMVNSVVPVEKLEEEWEQTRLELERLREALKAEVDPDADDGIQADHRPGAGRIEVSRDPP